MGKPKNKKRKNAEGHHVSRNQDKNKRPKGMPPKGKKHYKKKARYWIETCNDTRPGTGISSEMTLLITRVELMDDHTHGPNQTKVSTTPTESSSSSPSAKVTEKPESALTKAAEEAKNQDEQNSNVTNSDSKESEATPTAKKDVRTNSKGKESCDSKETETDYSNAFISVRRTSSAKGKPKKYPVQNYKPLPNGDCGDGIVNPYPSKVEDKFWAQRRRLFSRFDEGIQLDSESWFSVTPEAIAIHIAERLAQQFSVTTANENMIVLDAFCGCGGNAIAFGSRPDVSLVVCVDTDRSKLRLAAQNASIYGVPSHKLLFLEADACKVMTAYRDGKRISSTVIDGSGVEDFCGYRVGGLSLLPEQMHAIFLSPPWGGMDYENIGPRNYNLATCIKVGADKGGECKQSNGEDILVMAVSALQNPIVAYFLPRNTNGVSVSRSALQSGIRGEIEMEQNVLNGKFKTITAYFGVKTNQPKD